MSKLLKFVNYIPKRDFSGTQCLEGKRNFKKFLLYGKRGTTIFKKQQQKKPDPEMPEYTRGVRKTGYEFDGRFVNIPELIPELIVPDLKDCNLRPYVSYRTPTVIQSEFTPRDLFNAVYAQKIASDFKLGELDEDGNPLKPSADESQSSEEAYVKARKTGSDLFTQDK